MHILLLLVLSFLQLASSLQLTLPPYPGGNQLYPASGQPLCPLKNSTNWIILSPQWSVLGPFPAGMREHQLGAFPALTMHPLPELFSLSDPVEIPSTYGTAAHVKAKAFQAKEQSQSELEDASIARAWYSIRISYPELDWKAIQHSVGWAGIQWQALSIADLKIGGQSLAIVSITLDSAAEFAVLSEEEYNNYTWDNCSSHVKWYSGDWYSYTRENTISGSRSPAHLLTLEPGRYRIIVKAVYELRLFGGMKDAAPVIEFGLDVRIQEAGSIGAITTGQSVVIPDVVDGILAGWGVSFPLQSYWQQPGDVQEVEIVGVAGKYLYSQSSSLPLVLAPLQLRSIKLQVTSTEPLPVSITGFTIRIGYRVGSSRRYLDVHLPLKHVEAFSAKSTGKYPVQYQYTYLDSDQTVQYAIATAPRNILAGKDNEVRPAILYLHGAGVDVRLDEARNTFLSQKDSWIIEPSGRSPWGYDWQTASHLSARSALQQFSDHMYGLPECVKGKAARIDKKKAMITGHSNGGQGAYYFASHRPDEVIGAIVGAGYISLADYVPLTWQLGRHFNDASLVGVLRSSFNAFDNDLFASNMAGLPMLIKYGSSDDNVPIWHSREMVSLIDMWNRQGNASRELIKVSEVAGRSHHWPEFMRESDVQGALDARLKLNSGYEMPAPLDHFTLSVFNPEDSGSKQGWRITQVEVPGRMGRLEVLYQDGEQSIKVRSVHVLQLQVDFNGAGLGIMPRHIDIDGTRLAVSEAATRSKGFTLTKSEAEWSETATSDTSRPMGPMIRFLSSSGPIYAVVPTDCSEVITQHYYSIALRFSTDAYLYGRLDTVILYDHEALHTRQLRQTNVLLLGGPTLNKISRLASNSQTVINFLSGSSQFKIRDRIYAEGITLLTLLPHPFAEKEEREVGMEQEGGPRPMALLVHGTDSLSIERGYSLLPMRTGTLLPEWIVVDKSSMWKGYGGVVGAGWYDHDWAWSEAMSFLS